MTNLNDEFDRAIAALQATKLVRHHHASGAEGAKLVEQIATMLDAQASTAGAYGGIARNVALAIVRAILNRETLVENETPAGGVKAAALEKVLEGLSENNATDVELLQAGKRWLRQYPNR
ncbi:hypothetical protein [Caulobacter soli]|uniref:hypothetical protein n=1 Tax=Caulobacter soli TaxID=2708539 RepID=UPI0013EA1D09|nr:hypothetical protein [Caulobacter soli]